jgi:DNA-directed RNA polymerase subunit RPC12/RpoP
MAISVACSGCGTKFRAKDRHAGRRTKCPACGRAIVVPVGHRATPNGQATAPPSPQRPTAAQDVTRVGSGDREEEYVSPPFRPLGSSPDIPSSGHHAPSPAKAGRSGSSRRRGSPRDPWYDPLSRSLGMASLGIGGALLILGLPAVQLRGGGAQGAVLVVGCSLAALIAGAGLLLLADMARSLRRLSRRADRDADLLRHVGAALPTSGEDR